MKKGFTLIELLVVLAIIGILAAMIIASLTNARARARDAQRKSDLRQIKTANEQYYQDHNQTYSPDIYAAAPDGLAPDYMRAVPQSPFSPPVNYTYTSGACIGGSGTGYSVRGDIENNSETATAGVLQGNCGGNGVYDAGARDMWFQVSND